VGCAAAAASPHKLEDDPRSQLLQAEPRSAPLAEVQVPAGHARHAIASKSPFHEPASQAWHAEAPAEAPNLPGSQRMQTVSLAWPSAGWYVPALQGEHVLAALAPRRLLQVPAGHLLQLSCDVDPSRSLQVPGAQAMHCDCDAAPS